MNEAQLKAAENAMECFATAHNHLDHFCKVTEVEGRWYWSVRFPKGHKHYHGMVVGDMELPFNTTITPCNTSARV